MRGSLVAQSEAGSVPEDRQLLGLCVSRCLSLWPQSSYTAPMHRGSLGPGSGELYWATPTHFSREQVLLTVWDPFRKWIEALPCRLLNPNYHETPFPERIFLLWCPQCSRFRYGPPLHWGGNTGVLQGSRESDNGSTSLGDCNPLGEMNGPIEHSRKLCAK